MAARLILSASLFLGALAIPTPQSTSSNTTYTTNTTYTNTSSSTPANSAEASLVLPASISNYGGPKANWYHGPAFLPPGQSLRPALPQTQTNGDSCLGTFDAPVLPPWLNTSGEPMPQGRPWGGRTAQNTNPYTSPPETGLTRHYDFTLSEMTVAPDGVQKNGIVVNGQFPGPTIEANWGDYIEVTVTNNLPDEGTSMHWHGLLQTETPWFDGVPAVQQCPVAPGSSFTYRFKADLYGSSWYHSHYSAQYAGGAMGPMIIYGPHENADYDIDLGPVMLTDWFHSDYFSLIEDVMAPIAENRPPPMSNNNLINGKMNYPCSSVTNATNATDPEAFKSCTPNAGVSKFTFQSGKKHRLRLINAGAEGMQKFSIDGYQLTVIANDFVPIVPYTTDHITLGVGQRTDIVVEATGSPTDSVWMRSTLGDFKTGGCALNDGVSPVAVAAIYYENANTNAAPNTTTTLTTAEINQCFNDPLYLTVPYYSLTPEPNPQTTENIDITLQSNGTHNLWYMNNSTFRADYNDPILMDAKNGKDTFAPESNVLNFGSNKTVRLVLYNYGQQGAHPMHLHGHNFYVLAEGFGTWDGTVNNTSNPQRRDVQILQNAQGSPTDPTPAYVVIQLDMDNPGVWPLHCHIAWHVSAGLYVNVLEQPQTIQSEMQIPSTMAQTCRAWWAFTGSNVVDEIDSGL